MTATKSATRPSIPVQRAVDGATGAVTAVRTGVRSHPQEVLIVLATLLFVVVFGLLGVALIAL